VRLQSALRASGHDAWLDEQRIEGGATLLSVIEQAIDRSDVVLALLTQGSFPSPFAALNNCARCVSASASFRCWGTDADRALPHAVYHPR
jgi:hypothetical protein